MVNQEGRSTLGDTRATPYEEAKILQGDKIPKAPPKPRYMFEHEGDRVVKIVVSADNKPHKFANSGMKLG